MCSFLPIELSRVFSPLLTDRGFSSVQQIHTHSHLDGYWHVGTTQHILVIFFDQGIDLSCETVRVHSFDVSPPWVNTCPAFIWFCVSTVAVHEKAMAVFLSVFSLPLACIFHFLPLQELTLPCLTCPPMMWEWSCHWVGGCTNLPNPYHSFFWMPAASFINLEAWKIVIIPSWPGDYSVSSFLLKSPPLSYLLAKIWSLKSFLLL